MAVRVDDKNAVEENIARKVDVLAVPIAVGERGAVAERVDVVDAHRSSGLLEVGS